MKKILILGAKGMLGRDLAQHFSDLKPILWDREELDISDSRKAIKAIKAVKPKIIINAAAYVDVDGAEFNQELSMRINGEALGYLAKAAISVNAILIHYSTDYVFGQEKKSGYKENDLPKNPLNVYGRSKLLGEQKLLAARKKGLKFYLIRTSWLFGKNGKNFVSIMLEKAKTEKEIKVVNNQHGRPTYAKDLAKTTKHMITSKQSFGIYHFTNLPTLTWFRFAKLIFKIQKELDPGFEAPKIVSIKSKDLSRPAKRPCFSVLLNTKLPKARKINDALRDYFKDAQDTRRNDEGRNKVSALWT